MRAYFSSVFVCGSAFHLVCSPDWLGPGFGPVVYVRPVLACTIFTVPE